MKISLLYSEGAGVGVSADSLREQIERAGHQVVDVVEKDSDVERMLERPAELVVAAGGDGTVWRAANALAGRGIPLAILPVGTANNIASSLCQSDSIEGEIESWHRGQVRAIDMGVARGHWGETRFLEGVGGGLVPRGIRTMIEAPPDDEKASRGARLRRALECYRGVLARMSARHWSLRVDKEQMDGDFLLLEVLNIRSVGPNLVLSPDGDPSDGLFCVVMAGEEHRDRLERYLREKIEGRETRLSLPVKRAREVEIGGWDEMHVDDEVRSGSSIGAVSIRIEAGALQVLA
jgi:diacylglycerol kinase family enzyme